MRAMIELDPTEAECFVFTFKEGLLSKVAHDLKLRVTRFRLSLDAAASTVSAVLDASSLRVDSAMRSGREAPGVLGEADKRKIEASTVAEVLHSERHPEIRFEGRRVESASGGFEISGELTLHGRSRPLVLPVRREGDRLVAEVTLNQPDFGIKPFSAVLGTLKVQPVVRVRVTVPARAAEPA
jgi:polyisoprenoid-binding protein YceI